MHFISHSSSDKSAGLDLRNRLLAQGFDAQQIFLDCDEDSGIAAGEKWEQVLYERLKDCRALLVLCSPYWQQSKWCFAELVYAKMTGKEVFPIVLADCDLSVASGLQAVFVNKDGESAFMRLFNVLDARHLGPKDHLPWPHPELRDANGQLDDCPFPGLPAFDERYAAVYFGRERETQLILEELRRMRSRGEPRLLMIVGGSGSGKSSLLMAGVLPRLKHATSRSDWFVLTTLRFGRRTDPDALFELLADEIAAGYPPDAVAKGIHVPDRKKLRDQFADTNASTAAKAFQDAARDLTLACGCKDATVLLPVDQFEEFLPPSGGSNGERFLTFLEQVCKYRNDRLLMIGTMRSDYLDVYERQPYALKSPTFYPWRLEPFVRDQIESVIIKPAARAHVDVSPELLTELKKETPTTDALPLLAFTLEKLYRAHAADKKLDLSEYRSLGGMEGSIRHTAQQIMEANPLPSHVESAVRLSFVKHLAQVNEKNEFVRLTARWKDIDPAAYPILEEFVMQRLLIKSNRDGEVTLEVAHEAIFRCWEQLKVWLRASADILRWRRDIQRDQASDKKWLGLRPAQLAIAREWPNQRRNELSDDEAKWIKQGIRRERIVRGTVAAVILLITSLGASAWYQRSVAREQTALVQREAGVAEADALAHYALRQFDSGAHLEALQSAREAGRKLREVVGKTDRFEDYPTVTPLLAIQKILDNICEVDRIEHWRKENNDEQSMSHKQSPIPASCFLVEGYERTAVRDLTNEQLRRLMGHDGLVLRHACSADEKLLVTTGRDGTVRLRRLHVARPARQVGLHAGATHLEFLPGGNQAITEDVWGTRVFWDFSGKNLARHSVLLEGHEERAFCISFNRTNERIATGGADGKVRIWDRNGNQVMNALDHGQVVFDVEFTDNPSQIISVGQDGFVKTWDLSGNLIHEMQTQQGVTVIGTDFSPDGRRIAMTRAGGGGWLWNTATRSGVAFGKSHRGWIYGSAFNPDGSQLATAGADDTVRFWDLAGKELGDHIITKQTQTLHVTFAPDGNHLSTSGHDGTVKIWTRSGEQVSHLVGHTGAVLSVEFSPNGKLIATAGRDGTVRVWLRSGRQLAEFNGFYGALHMEALGGDFGTPKIAFSPDSTTIAIPDNDGSIRLWRIQDLNELLTVADEWLQPFVSSHNGPK